MIDQVQQNLQFKQKMILRRCNPFLTTAERKPEAAQAPFEA